MVVWVGTLLITYTKPDWTPTIQDLATVGVSIPVVGLVVALAGRPRLILFIVPCCVAAVWFWVTTIMP